MKTVYVIRIGMVCLFLILVIIGIAQNPVIKDIGMSDPHARVFNDTLFLYTGHDTHPNDKTWVMKEWQVFSTTDLVNWTKRATISPKDNYMPDNSTDCWASDAASRNEKYYFYFSDRKRGVGVMTSQTPTGPFNDALGKPLVSPMHDPTILIDDNKNKTPYLVYGDKEGGGFHIARLNDDMISLSEKPKLIQINGDEWDKAPNWMDKNYIFKYKGIYYLSWGRDYAIAKDIYGPYQCIGEVGKGHHLSEFAHGSFFWWKGQFYHIWCYYIRPGFKYRESIITYCHFTNDGKIITDTNFLDLHFEYGVGRYNAGWDKIEAEWFYEKSAEIEKKQLNENSFQLANIKNNAWIKFSNVSFINDSNRFYANLSGKNKNDKLEIRLNNPKGKLVGVVQDGSVIAENEQKTISAQINIPKGIHDVYIVAQGDLNTNVSIDWIKFSIN